MVSVRVLVVDDDHTSAAWMKILLDSSGLRAEVALGSSQAKVLLKKNRFDVLLIDYLMVTQGGLDLLRWCRAESILTPAIIHTGVSADAVEQISQAIDAERLEPAIVLIKPVEPTVLLERICRMAQTKEPS